MLPTLHNVDAGVKRLLSMPLDLPHRHQLRERVEIGAASVEHRQIFGEYCAELTAAVAKAEEWWAGMLLKAESRGASTSQAVRGLYGIRPAGPASHPSVVAVIRHYWLACDEMNELFHPRVPPQIFLIAWLVDRRMDRELSVVTGMPYWPIGLDENGNWV
ncbi:hypothetical protein CI15_29930 [Paraburkholderia monticola]|uniref:Uncharacterized protein n=1 Tax=Paraburkholderia monticola TaxID=1399968 RepID=A0A149PE64_9BURK|nr:hypothetical protein [Paraburkholderia monticola]KXU83314.1 hypothetical protein CI15_29930 [Paraburkholderia monticola]